VRTDSKCPGTYGGEEKEMGMLTTNEAIARSTSACHLSQQKESC